MKNEGKGYTSYKKNAPAERPDERKVCGTQNDRQRQERVAETVKRWKSYTCFSADYFSLCKLFTVTSLIPFISS